MRANPILRMLIIEIVDAGGFIAGRANWCYRALLERIFFLCFMNILINPVSCLCGTPITQSARVAQAALRQLLSHSGCASVCAWSRSIGIARPGQLTARINAPLASLGAYVFS
jgi:hypothetical protein